MDKEENTVVVLVGNPFNNINTKDNRREHFRKVSIQRYNKGKVII